MSKEFKNYIVYFIGGHRICLKANELVTFLEAGGAQWQGALENKNDKIPYLNINTNNILYVVDEKMADMLLIKEPPISPYTYTPTIDIPNSTGTQTIKIPSGTPVVC